MRENLNSIFTIIDKKKCSYSNLTAMGNFEISNIVTYRIISVFHCTQLYTVSLLIEFVVKTYVVYSNQANGIMCN